MRCAACTWAQIGLILCCSVPGYSVEFNVGVLLAFDVPSVPWTLSQGAKAAIELAQEKVTANGSLLFGHTLNITYDDTQCSSAVGTVVGINLYIEYAPDVFIGPGCRGAIQQMGRFSFFWNIPQVIFIDRLSTGI